MLRDVNTSMAFRVLGQPIAELPEYSASFPSRGYALITLLCMSPGFRLSRAAIADRIWRNSSDAANLANLRQLLKRMQLSKPDLTNCINFDNQSVWVTKGCKGIDLVQFLSMGEVAAQDQITCVMDLYRGSVLDGLNLDSSRLDEELPGFRVQLASRYFSLIETGLTNLTRYGRTNFALLMDIEQHTLGIDPDREETYRALMEAYRAAGHDKEVSRLFEVFSSRAAEAGLVVETVRPATTRRLSRIQANPRELRQDTSLMEPPRLAILAPKKIGEGGLSATLARSFIEDLANEMSRDRRFRTLAAHSSFQAKNDGGVLDENGELRADFTFHSKIVSGPELGKLSARLVDMSNRTILWSDEFALAEVGLFSTGRRLVNRVAIEMTATLEDLSLSESGNSNSAYLSFLLAQRALKKCDLKSVRRARRHFLDVLRQDESHSEAYSGISFSLYLEWLLTGGNEPRLLVEARELADSAIISRPQCSSGHWRKAMVSLYQHDFETSEACFETAHELHPNSADILLDQSDALGFIGSPDHAWRLFEQALDLNPLPPEHYWWAGASIAFSKADYAHAVELCDQLDNDEPVLRLLAACHGQLGNTSEARDYGSRLIETYPNQTAAEMTRLQPHRSATDLEPFVEGLRLAGLK
ncbi:hypothetical protein N9L47_07245 [Rhodobacteraceae bacterium]|nr:hypothetical protein [Paracoccaceae bacterium]